MSDRPWTIEDLPDLVGRTAIVTGANSGLGYETALALAGAGAHVVLACRDRGRADAATVDIRAVHGDASVESMELDLANLISVRDFAKAFLDRHDRLHLLCNNAGVMALPYRRTADGFEMQFGTNHLGHFALTGLLLPRLIDSAPSRVVNLSSTGHRAGAINFDDLQSERRYSKWRAYAQSKLANLLFTYELQRRLDAAGADVISAASHPGWAATNLQTTGPRMAGSGWMERVAGIGNRLFSQTAAMGALPSLYAATAAGISGGDYIGPGGFAQTWGHPVVVDSSARSRDVEVAARLWEVSEALTGVHYETLASPAAS